MANSPESALQPSDARQRLARAIGRIPSGLFVLTARSGPRRAALLASWVQQAGFDPPTISVGVAKGRPIVQWLEESGRFYLNVIGTQAQAVFRQFGKGHGPDEDPFVGMAAADVPGGVALAERVAGLACRVCGRLEVGDHWLYVAEVEEADGDESQPPYVHVRKNGLSY